MNANLLPHDNKKILRFIRNKQRLLLQEAATVRYVVRAVTSDAEFAGGADDKVLLAPPMISHVVGRSKRHPSVSGDALVICYIGLVRGNLYGLNDLVTAFARARQRLRDRVRLILVEATPSGRTMPLTAELLDGVEYTPHAISHAQALAIYADQCHLGFRVVSALDAITLGTKIVEMAGSGLPSVVDNSETNVDLFGSQYPYYVNVSAVAAGSQEAIATVTSIFERAVANASEYEQAAAMALACVHAYTFEAMRQRVQPWLKQVHRDRVRVAIVVGVRPNVVKAAALVRAMRAHTMPLFSIDLIYTGQHGAGDMINPFFRDLQLESPTHEIEPMAAGATRQVVCARPLAVLTRQFW
jgi:hypothetical protein